MPPALDASSPRSLPPLHGTELLDTPTLNKGTAFTLEERAALGLHGLLPPYVETLDEQVLRAHRAFRHKDDDLERHIFLRALQDTNEVLYYRLLLDHLEEMMPIVYTPVVALGCQEFSHIYRRPRGLFLPYPLRHAIPELLRNRPHPEVDVIVVTDGERILGIGDQGVGGLGIPIGKLSLYTLIGGIAPERTLPIVLDVGTNNPEALRDPSYLGWRHARITGADYFAFIEAFVRAVRDELPNVCLQWEDFSAAHARPILERYRNELLTFNDDIQGTAAVVLAAVLGGLRRSGGRLRDQTFAILGAGSAGLGVAEYLHAALVDDGVAPSDAAARFWLLNSHGLVHDRRTDLADAQRPFARPAAPLVEWPRSPGGAIDLATVVARANPTVLVGLSTVGGAFTETIVRSMAAASERPIILPLSNPTARAEAHPADLLRWSDGRALVATGSPFPPVQMGGTTIPVAQCNNVYIFPGVGLGLIASGARRVTDAMILDAARGLVAAARAGSDDPILPALTELRAVTEEVALSVGLSAQRGGVAPPRPAAELRDRIRAIRWSPSYPSYIGG